MRERWVVLLGVRKERKKRKRDASGHTHLSKISIDGSHLDLMLDILVASPSPLPPSPASACAKASSKPSNNTDTSSQGRRSTAKRARDDGSSTAHSRGSLHCCVVAVPCSHVWGISSLRLAVPKGIAASTDKQTGVLRDLLTVQQRVGAGGLPRLDPRDDLGVLDEEFGRVVKRLEAVEHRLLSLPDVRKQGLWNCLDACGASQLVEATQRRLTLAQTALRTCKDEDDCEGQLKGMRRVLRRLGHVDKDGVLLSKGRLTCQITVADELIASELVFSGLVMSVSAVTLCGLLSCLVCSEKSKCEFVNLLATSGRGNAQEDSTSAGESKDDAEGSATAGERGESEQAKDASANGQGAASSSSSVARLMKEMAIPYRRLQAIAKRVVEAMNDARLEVDEEKYLEALQPSLAAPVMLWCTGASFAEVLNLTELFEGSLVRTLRQVAELLRQMAAASGAIGNPPLVQRLVESQKLLHRGVPFAGSLYL